MPLLGRFFGNIRHARFLGAANSRGTPTAANWETGELEICRRFPASQVSRFPAGSPAARRPRQAGGSRAVSRRGLVAPGVVRGGARAGRAWRPYWVAPARSLGPHGSSPGGWTLPRCCRGLGKGALNLQADAPDIIPFSNDCFQLEHRPGRIQS
jgi:hypothetical protein